MTSILHPDSTWVHHNYGGGNVAITDEVGHTTEQHWQRFGSPSGGRPASVRDAAWAVWSYSYNVFGSLTRVDAPTGPDREWQYNSANELVSETQPESGTTTYTYNGGRLETRTDALGRKSTYQYDSGDRLTQIKAPVSSDSATFEYDADDNRTRMVSGGTESLFTYAAGRLTSREDRIHGHAFTTGYGYDDFDNLTTLTYPSGRVVQYQYDASNRLTKVYSGSTVYAENLTYHPSGALASASYGNGKTFAQTLDDRGRPFHRQDGPLDVTYGYFANGNVHTIDDPRSGMSASFGYDELDRLTSISGGLGSGTYQYDPQGNRTFKDHGTSNQVAYTYSSTTNRLSTATGSPGVPYTGTFSYDSVGNMTGVDTSEFTYTSTNMMKTAKVGNVTTNYAYDAAGLRAVKSSPSAVTYYVHGLGSQVLSEYDATTGAPALAREYLYLGGQLLAAFTGSTPTPTVAAQLTAPVAGLVTPADVPVTLTASASLTGTGSITSVQFYANGLFLGSDNAAPYTLTWTPTSSGSVSLTARAVASTGKIGHGPPVAVTVTAIGRVLGVSASPSSVIAGQASTVTVTGNSYPCGAVQINWGDGNVETIPHSASLASSPIARSHIWGSSGTKTVTVTGQGDCEGEVTTTVTVSGNSGPAISLTAPTAGTYTGGTAITLTASASDAQGVASVEFYDGTTLLYTDTSAPWTYSWTGASDGPHTVWARAIDTFAEATNSAGVTLTVQDIESVGVSPSAPVAGQWSTITVYGAAIGCWAVTVDYGDGDVVTYAIDGLPITNYHVWATGGSKTITATGQGNCSGSAQTTVHVNAAPSVSLTSPAGSDTFYSPATVTMTATASDSDGSVASVAFYAGSTWLSTDTSAPYSYTWTSVSNGIYSLTAVATDNQGAVVSSSAVAITVNDPAASTVTGVSVSPSTAAINTWVTVTVTGGNPCGAVQINWGDGDMPYLPIEGLPYQRTHYYSSPGTYTITASGQGNCSGQASTSITITTSDMGTLRAGSLPGIDSSLRWSSVSKARSAARTERLFFRESEDMDSVSDDSLAVMPALPPAVTLALDILPGASGTVTSSPAGFNCTGSDTTCTATFDLNAAVTLTATAASGQVFVGWGGACAGTSTCVVTAADGLVVTAAFAAPGSATITYYHTDILGSVRAITDASGGTVTRIDYAPFGETNAALEGDPRRFIGGEQDAETAFQYFAARYYRNVWGRFTSADASAFMDPFNPQSFNLYSYASNNPLKWIDPSGHAPQDYAGIVVVHIEVTPSGSSWWSKFTAMFGGGVNEWQFAMEGLTFFTKGPRPIPAGIQFNRSWTPKEFWGGIQDAGEVAQIGVNYSLIVASPNLALMGATLLPFGEVTSLGRLTSFSGGHLNELMGTAQRRLIGELFKTGELSLGLTSRTLQLYREVAIKAISEGKDSLGVQAARLALIEQILRSMGK